MSWERLFSNPLSGGVIDILAEGERVGGILIFSSVEALNARLRTTPHSPLNVEVEGEVGWLPTIELRPSLRGQGVGTKLLHTAITEAEHRGLSALFIHAGDPWSHSTSRQVQFWGRLGFKKLRFDDGIYFAQPMMLPLQGVVE